VASSITVIQALLWENLNEHDEIVIKNLKRRRDAYQTILQNIYLNYLNMIYEWNSQFNKTK